MLTRQALGHRDAEDGRRRVASALDEARRRTWLLCQGLSDEALHEAACSYLSPPAWDLGHIANFEELWLVQHLADAPEMHRGFNETYNAFEHPRHERPRLDLLDRGAASRYMQAVRRRALQVLEGVDAAADDPLLRDHFVHWMIVLHEHQHQETLLQSFVMRGTGGGYRPPPRRPLPAPRRDVEPTWIEVPGGPFEMGTRHRAGVYDNEAPPHLVEVPAFRIRSHPVTCGEYLRFVEDGGYGQDRHWSERGRAWRDETGAEAPLYWHCDGGTWHRTNLTGTAPVADMDEILCHVSFFEAEAFAAWAGARLPTEQEWEKACRHDAASGTSRRNPWGDDPASTDRANIDQLGLGPSRVGAYPDGETPSGAAHLIGDVWEWTASGWEPYPGFEAFPYPEYSQVFFGGDHRVLRGGSWATRAGCATGTFRNWDHPRRRQIFTGIRLAR